jgi:F-type H+-transporting ATPase subunit epsilon
MHLKIITHENIVFDEDVDEIYSKALNGEFGVLKDHIPFMNTLDIAVTKVVQGQKNRYFSVIGGIFQFKNNEALILTQAAEEGQNIDVVRAEEAQKRAEARLNSNQEDVDARRAEVALAKAKARLKAALSK